MTVALSDVKRRLGTTQQLRKVTGTLQKVASARLARDRGRVADEAVYLAGVCRALALAYRAAPEVAAAHALMAPRAGSRSTLVVCGGDRGLCGSFNTALMARAATFVADEQAAGRQPQVLFRGKVVARRAARQELGEEAPYATAEELQEALMARYAAGETDRIHLLYWRFDSAIAQALVIEQVLPVPVDRLMDALGSVAEGASGMVGIEPDAASVIDKLLPEYVRCCIRACYWHSAISEHAQRQTAMARATENAGEVIGDLSRQYRRLRQESITTEMLELIGGMDNAS
jgi:F-type H+-transporting ATPase subunit gamma